MQQPNQPMQTGQFVQQNYPAQQRLPQQQNPMIQQNQLTQQNSQIQQNQQMQQNYQMQNQQFQSNPQIHLNQQISQNQQNYQMNPNSQIPQMPNNQQNYQMPQMHNNQQNYMMQSNPQMQQNQQMQPNPQMQTNQETQQQNAPIMGSQSRPLPPRLPRNSSQNLYPSIQRMSSQRIPLRSASSMNSSNGSMPLQQSMQFNSMASMQSVGSSDSDEMFNQQQPQQQQQQQPLSRQSSSQVFLVVYNNITYKVDPELLSNASPKIKEMLLPFIQENRLEDAHLEVFGHNFTYRNINNFLKLCQNLPTDVENSEMKEICEIAKLFGAEKIYDTGASFIRQNMDPNFSIPDSKYDGSDGKKYMCIEDERHVIDHSSEIQSNLGKNDYDEDDEADNNDVKQNPAPAATESNADDEKPLDTTKISSVIYKVKVEKHALKCNIFHFYNDKDVMFTAKQKNENIFVGEGYDVHIKSNQKNHVAHISQDDCLHNIIFLKDKNFKLKYVNSGKPNHLSIDVTFPLNKDKMITWKPKPPKYNPLTDKYYLNFHGEHHHTPMKSKKNIVLQNDQGHPTFIVRKMDYDMYEIECLPLVDPLVAFIIGLSDIVGPYMDPCGDIVF